MSDTPSTLRELQRLGQSPWLDYITRGMLTSGALAKLVRNGDVTGLTSNPTIFEQAISKTRDYDEALAALVRAGRGVDAIVDALMIEDVQAAADLFKPVYQRTKRADGYVSIEISPELANDTAATVREAARMWRAVNRPNLMVKIPATAAGIPAITATIAAGINVNVTLIFSIERYREVMQAYLDGLTRRLESGLAVDRIASVASFFVSRVDTAVDRLLEERVGGVSGDRRTAIEQLRGKAAIANAKVAYRAFRDTFDSEAFAVLARAGARPQRPLWASTSTKNPAYPDVYYVEALIGPNTVNTLPPHTLEAYRDHGHPESRLDLALDRAKAVLAQLEHLGIDMQRITARLESEGVASFAASWAQLKRVVEARREAVLFAERAQVDLGAAAGAITKAAAALDAADVTARLFRKDASLWPEPSAGDAGSAERLGWLDVCETMPPELPRLASFVDEVRAAGITHVLLCGMGGSSLAPQLLRRTLGVAKGYPDLRVLDSTDPAAVAAADAWSDPAHTLYLISSKSGTTAEVEAFLQHYWARATAALGDAAASHFAAITDPGTPLDELATSRGFRGVFRNPADIGGRYAALSLVGLVPAALIGADTARLLERARRMLLACSTLVRADQNPGVFLGAALATLAGRGRDKVTFLAADRVQSFADWAEQLLAESTGKQGRGLIPVVGEPPGPPSEYGTDRVFVHLRASDPKARPLATLGRAGHPCFALRLNDAYDLGAEFVRWEIAVAVAGHLIGVNPFDQPDVQQSKVHTKRLLLRLGAGVPLPAPEHAISIADPAAADRLAAHLRAVRPHGYLALCAFLAPTPRRERLLHDLRVALRKRLGLLTTLGWGPRFLHSTGQLHKGGPATVTVLQLTADDPADQPVPGTPYSFGVLKAAQALGDQQALAESGRPVLRIHLDASVERGLQRLVALATKLPKPGARAGSGRSGTGRAGVGRARRRVS
ncbi:MAG TPA: bifunctional transaldolase/phosoglucose isomerase [Candidatus Limnocylindria bacterium]|nr:bifunctional transaldolase/phosoglucose isomerase [Candidatus Limnocylindria bacterium]